MPRRGRACHVRRRRQRRSPDRRTTATSGGRCARWTTRPPWGPPYGSRSTGAASRHGRSGRSTAVASRREPRNEIWGAVRKRRDGRVRHELDTVERLPLRLRLGQRGGAHDDRAAGGGDAVHARLVGQRLEARRRRPSPHVQHRGVVERVGEEQHTGPVDGRHGAHLQLGRRHRLTIDEQAAGAVAIGARRRADRADRAEARRPPARPTRRPGRATAMTWRPENGSTSNTASSR